VPAPKPATTPLAVALAAVTAVAVAGCREVPTAVRVAIYDAGNVAAPLTDVRLDLYDRFGRIIDDARLPHEGDVLVLVSPDATLVRGIARAQDRDGRTVRGIGAVDVVAGTEITLALGLERRDFGDRDGDGIPDVIDNCPAERNPDQASRDGGPLGDACAPVTPPDLGSSLDLSETAPAPMPDLGPSPPGCGDGLVNSATEQCDSGAANSDTPSASAGCTTRCRRRAPCGDLNGAARAAIDPATGHCYVAWDAQLPWAAAERDCLARAGHLASITTSGEDAVVTAVAGGAERWIGMPIVPGQPNTWVTGEKATFTAFAPNEPTGGRSRCLVTSASKGGWADRSCGWSSTGQLPLVLNNTFPYVCEHACGNGIVEPGEECEVGDPGCLPTCVRARACTEPGGKISAGTGHCFFVYGTTALSYDAAKTACPTGTHLATLESITEAEAAALAVGTTPAWIALRAPTTAGVLAWEAPASIPFDPGRFHNFDNGEPNDNVPECVRVEVGGLWRDRVCDATSTFAYLPLCERD
jgi:hypothetical protein